MKAKKPELDIDIIGGQGPLTPEEDKALTEFFKKKKASGAKTVSAKKLNVTKSSPGARPNL